MQNAIFLGNDNGKEGKKVIKIVEKSKQSFFKWFSSLKKKLTNMVYTLIKTLEKGGKTGLITLSVV